MKGKELWLFNLATDLDNPVLAATHTWIKEFSRHVDKIYVVSTHVGRYDLPENVEVIELNGGSLKLRVSAAIKLFRIAVRIIKSKPNTMVLHHMSHKTAALIGLPLRIAKVNQGLWYSHSAKTFSLLCAQFCVDRIFTSVPGAYPFNSKKIIYVGHGIEVAKFITNVEIKRSDPYSILSVGRITPIKKLQDILEAISRIPNEIKNQISIDFIGPIEDEAYVKYLKKIAASNSINLSIIPGIPYSKINEIFKGYSIYFSGTPNSIDKATIEAAISGCYILTSNHNCLEFLEITNLEFKSDDLAVQLLAILKQNSDQLLLNRARISRIAADKNDVTKTCLTILSNINEK